MSLELKIEALTAAVTALTAQLQAGNVAAPAPVAPTPAPVVQAAPITVSVVDTPAPVAAAPAMPAPPTFVAPVAAPVATGAPFSDPKGLIDYVMGAYKALGPQKGALIQGVLTGLGYQNINDVKPEHYAALHTGVEALKG
jgi:hypothetical protein